MKGARVQGRRRPRRKGTAGGVLKGWWACRDRACAPGGRAGSRAGQREGEELTRRQGQIRVRNVG